MSNARWKPRAKPTTRLAGHGLLNEGAAFTYRGNFIGHWGVGGPGHAKCSCGELSPELSSGAERKAWHKEHKLEVAGGAA